MRKAVAAFLLLFLPGAVFAAQKPHATTPAVPPPSTAQQLDKLFGDLQKAQDEDDAKDIAQRITNIFTASGSPSVDLLMARAQVALTADKIKIARKLIEAVTQLDPKFAEGWHRLAALQAQAKDDRGAIVSLQKTIALNPRHFTACAELAGMLQDYGDKRGALKLYRQALALNPKMEGIEHEVRGLTREVEGEGI
jgi:tetratricopeptide (TPR) repeat protein